jgi:hypothetical protein
MSLHFVSVHTFIYFYPLVVNRLIFFAQFQILLDVPKFASVRTTDNRLDMPFVKVRFHYV